MSIKTFDFDETAQAEIAKTMAIQGHADEATCLRHALAWYSLCVEHQSEGGTITFMEVNGYQETVGVR